MPNGQDYSSLAYSLIPGIIGGLAGGPMGALAGFGKGMGDIEENRLVVQKQALEERRVAAQEERDRMLNLQAEENIKNLALERQRLELAVGEATKSKEARERYRTTLPEDKRQLFDLDPKEYIERTLEEERMRGGGKVLKQLGLENGEEMARMIGPKGTADVIEAAIKAKMTPRDKFWFHFDANSGRIFIGDQAAGTVTTKPLVDPKIPMERRIQARNQMLAEYEKAGTGMLYGTFDDYVASPKGQAHEAFILGTINRDAYNKLNQQFAREEEQMQQGAIDQLRREWSPGMLTRNTDQNFLAWLKTNEGQRRLFDTIARLRTPQRTGIPAETKEHPVEMAPKKAYEGGEPMPQPAANPPAGKQGVPKTLEEYKRMRARQ